MAQRDSRRSSPQRVGIDLRPDRVLCQDAAMNPAEIKAYVDRDWHLIRELKDRYWATRKGALRPEEALRIADTLRQQVRILRPSWPSERERESDRESHTHVAECLRRVRSPKRA